MTANYSLNDCRSREGELIFSHLVSECCVLLLSPELICLSIEVCVDHVIVIKTLITNKIESKGRCYFSFPINININGKITGSLSEIHSTSR